MQVVVSSILSLIHSHICYSRLDIFRCENSFENFVTWWNLSFKSVDLSYWVKPITASSVSIFTIYLRAALLLFTPYTNVCICMIKSRLSFSVDADDVIGVLARNREKYNFVCSVYSHPSLISLFHLLVYIDFNLIHQREAILHDFYCLPMYKMMNLQAHNKINQVVICSAIMNLSSGCFKWEPCHDQL